MITINEEQMNQLKRIYSEYYKKQNMDFTAQQIYDEVEVFYSILLRDGNTHTLFTTNGIH